MSSKNISEAHTRVLLPSDASPSQCPSGLAKIGEVYGSKQYKKKSLRLDKKNSKTTKPCKNWHIHKLNNDILQQNVILSCRFSACGKNPYTENANTSYYPAVLTFSYVRKLVLPPMMASRADRHTEWDDTTIMVLLRLIIETGFYVKHLNGDSGRKASLWTNLHTEFCINPDVIRFAGTSAGHQFSLKYRDLKYVKERFQTVKKEFRKVVAGIQRTGSGGPPPHGRFQFFDAMKEITLLDPSFFPPMIISSSSMLVGANAAPVISVSDQELLLISEGSFEPSSQLSYQSSFRLPSASVSATMPAPTPAPAPAPSSSAAGTENRRMTQREFQSAFLRNSERQTAIFDEAFSSLSSQLEEVKDAFVRSVECQYIHAVSFWEARRLDRASRDNNTREDVLARKQISRNDLLSREIIAREEREAKGKLLAFFKKSADTITQYLSASSTSHNNASD
ncbi:hypothetical protein PHYBLDRAFT_166889 [Phycomyces blakesleeanus NRRL 1555(-)]|uniref:Uncharacterized protein n=1 Tax=Phycomyces blakesleeanus (strain ATCC 8743b / DSM 1359 / FGSC 10004 / NBRC 33097 / NRRL 1555) TaxID=763407 RepID=A0A167NCC9_PHYB8|nr:hypothetical protein PHYBLDRAFT_166889 [Phycomyces blakesleeanus NRRL 1555(-)]OAD75659.1 hypothetical protein PHYBLDRAFT_166889 [Phycomyces blakesleeanus NRRL 1555(-)]|eukprot:XP_018293699.1 hypothetical protein PHYBLDRAFT_166889 [Phycomyces blakesleeanus NRRL 1555(-)]